MKILVTGKDGQIGRELQRALPPLGSVVALGRSELDIGNLQGLGDALRAHAPDVIVNAAAYTAVDKAESDAATAYRVNAEAVGIMARHAISSGALLVHYSTDYVFDGTKTGAYVESDAPRPQNAYGKTKRAGEEAIFQSGCNALIFRTSWVFSAHGHNFIKTILKLAAERDSLNIVADQHGAPTSAELVADVTAQAIKARHGKTLPPSLYHLAAAGETTWHELARHIVERAHANGMPLMLQSPRIRPISSEAYPLPAKRPKNSRLDTAALSRALGLDFPNWVAHVNRTVDQLTQRDKTA